jgi:hypothetical protein
VAETQAREAIAEWSQRGFQSEHYFSLMAAVTARTYMGDSATSHALAGELLDRTQRSLIVADPTLSVPSDSFARLVGVRHARGSPASENVRL